MQLQVKYDKSWIYTSNPDSDGRRRNSEYKENKLYKIIISSPVGAKYSYILKITDSTFFKIYDAIKQTVPCLSTVYHLALHTINSILR